MILKRVVFLPNRSKETHQLNSGQSKKANDNWHHDRSFDWLGAVNGIIAAWLVTRRLMI